MCVLVSCIHYTEHTLYMGLHSFLVNIAATIRVFVTLLSAPSGLGLPFPKNMRVDVYAEWS